MINNNIKSNNPPEAVTLSKFDEKINPEESELRKQKSDVIMSSSEQN